MAYTKRIVCLARSLKHGGLCIAGREITPQGLAGWIRPISSRPSAELTYLEYRYPDGASPQLLDILDVPLLAPAPQHHQTENHLIDPSRPWIKQRALPHAKLKLLAEDPLTLWCNQDHTSLGQHDCVTRAHAQQYRSSLCLIAQSHLTLQLGPASRTPGRRTYRGVFLHHGVPHNLSVTDPAARERFDTTHSRLIPFHNRPDLYLCLSLTEPFTWDNRCHKLIAAILTDPPL
jgi:hypothetical protein